MMKINISHLFIFLILTTSLYAQEKKTQFDRVEYTYSIVDHNLKQANRCVNYSFSKTADNNNRFEEIQTAFREGSRITAFDLQGKYDFLEKEPWGRQNVLSNEDLGKFIRLSAKEDLKIESENAIRKVESYENICKGIGIGVGFSLAVGACAYFYTKKSH